MRPGQLRVFDGLRVTTEHVDHFQASLHSAIRDLREILGLGMVYAGFNVAAADGSTVTVQPGLAFDFQKNRVVLDERQTVEVAFAENQDTAFVCAKYDQIEGGETEGRTTLIWDSCSLVVRPSPPGESDNLVVLARVTKGADGALAVTDLTRGEPVEEPAAAEDAGAAKTPAAPSLMVRQGVLRLTPGSADGYPGASIAEQVQSASGRIAGSGHDLMIELARVSVPVGYPVASFSCHLRISFTVKPADAEPTNGRAAVTAEATCSAEGISQFGVSSSPTEEVMEDALARVPLGSPGNTAGSQPAAADVLGRLALVVRAERSDAGLSIVCNLVWTDITTEELVRQLDTFKPALTWSNQVAWKAIGQI